MKIIYAFFLFLAITINGFGQDITGKWYGQTDLGVIKLRIIFNFEKNGDTYSGTMQSPDQSTQERSITKATFENNELNIAIASLSFIYTGTLNEEGIIDGSFTQMGSTFPLKLSREEIKREKRPQEPNTPYPYKEEEVSFSNKKANIKLAGTLTTPEKGSDFTAVVLVSGSGAQNRNSELLGHKPFHVIADFLTRQGIAVLRYDDRGIEKSEGNYVTSNIPDFADDVAAAIDYLKTRKEINSQKIGIIGHSEGGMVAVMLASENIPSFIVSLAGPGITGREVMRTQREALYRLSNVPETFINQHNELFSKIEEVVIDPDFKRELFKDKLKPLIAGTPLERQEEILLNQISSPEMISLLKYDPAAYFNNIKCPVLALNGNKDIQIISGINLEGFEQITTNGNTKVTIKEYPRLNHLFQTCTTGLPVEYGDIEETISPKVLNDIAGWILNL